MRSQFVECKARRQAVKLCPWASTIIKVDGGYKCFESESDASVFRGVSAPPKRGRGRPSITGETGQRYQVTIPPTVADKLRDLGSGSLSAGIIKAAGDYIHDKCT